MTNGPDNNVKINYTFEFPVTESLKERVSGYDNVQALGKVMNEVIGVKLIEFFKEGNPSFAGRFVVTKSADRVEGIFSTESMVKRSAEIKGCEYFKSLLKEFAGTDLVKADVNLACFF